MHLELLSICTLGLTAGGGTGRTVKTIHEGCANLGLKPITWQSSSLILFMISYARSAVSSCEHATNERQAECFDKTVMCSMPCTFYSGWVSLATCEAAKNCVPTCLRSVMFSAACSSSSFGFGNSIMMRKPSSLQDTVEVYAYIAAASMKVLRKTSMNVARHIRDHD